MSKHPGIEGSIPIHTFCLAFILAISSEGFERKYVFGGELTARQEADVLELARLAGVNSVAEIQTYYLRRDGVGIVAKEKESVTGRRVRYRVVRMVEKKWTTGWPFFPAPDTLRVGEFLLQSVNHQDLTTVFVGGSEFRIALDESVTPDQAEVLIEKLQDRAFELGPQVDRRMLQGPPMGAPLAIFAVDAPLFPDLALGVTFERTESSGQRQTRTFFVPKFRGPLRVLKVVITSE